MGPAVSGAPRAPAAALGGRAALALYFIHYDFCKFHKAIRMTPAMAAWVAHLLAAAQGAVPPVTLVRRSV